MRTKVKIDNEKQRVKEENLRQLYRHDEWELNEILKRQRIYRFIRDNHSIHYNIKDLLKLTDRIMKVMRGKDEY